MLSEAMREALPLQTLVKTVGAGLRMDPSSLTQFKTVAWKDNSGVLSLANLEPGQHTPRSHYHSVKVHRFKSHLTKSSPKPVTVEKITTKHQLVDMFMKPLSQESFVRLRFQLMGW
jgi:hypothetical protein